MQKTFQSPPQPHKPSHTFLQYPSHSLSPSSPLPPSEKKPKANLTIFHPSLPPTNQAFLAANYQSFIDIRPSPSTTAPTFQGKQSRTLLTANKFLYP